jgi:hypothetical protein
MVQRTGSQTDVSFGQGSIIGLNQSKKIFLTLLAGRQKGQKNKKMVYE